MSHEIERRASDGLARDQRRAVVAMSRANSDSQIAQARVDAEAEIGLAKIDAITTTTVYGMGAVAKVGQVELIAVQNFPTVAGRVAYLAEQHMLHVGEALADLQKKVSRK